MTKEAINNSALAAFGEKYGVACEIKYTEMIPDSTEDRDEIHVYVESLMEPYESAIIYSWEENGRSMSADDLFGFIVRDEYESAVASVAEKTFGNVKVYTKFFASSFDDSLVTDSTLADAYNAGEKMIASTFIAVQTVLSETDFKAAADKVALELKEAKLYSSNTFFAVSNAEDFEAVTRRNVLVNLDMFSSKSDVAMPFDAYENYSFDL